MKITKERFFAIGEKLNLSQETLINYWKELAQDDLASPFVKYLYYLGGLIVISSMTWFMTLGWGMFGGGGMFAIAALYALIFTYFAHKLWKNPATKIPAGLFITMAVCMVPLAVYGLETYFQMWPEDSTQEYQDFYTQVAGKWILIEVATIMAGIVAIYYFPFPFLTAPIFFAAWFLSLDLPAYFFEKGVSWEQRCWISMIVGLAILALGFWYDREEKEDYSFWSYLFGTLSFWGGLNCLVWNQGEATLIIYLFINIVMMFFAILLGRNVLMVFGALGVFAYLSHLAYDNFKDSILFPFVLTGIGILIISFGIFCQKNMANIRKSLITFLKGN